MLNFEKIVTNHEILEIEKNAIKSGLKESILIERAGQKISEFLSDTISNRKQILFVIGKGKNGKDGYVAFKNLIKKNFNCNILFVFPKLNYDNWESLPTNFSKSVFYYDETNQFHKLIQESDVIIDGIFGTGLNRNLNDNLKKLIYFINQQNKQVISIDLPSGLSDTNSFTDNKNTIIASKTLSLTAIKNNCLNFHTQKYANTLINFDIGISKFPESYKPKFLIDKEQSMKLIPNKDKYGNKRSGGNISIIGGSNRYPGAILMASSACIETGIGLINISIPSKIYDVVAGQIPEVSLNIDKESNEYITKESIKSILEKQSINSIMFGPGMETNKTTINATKYLIKNIANNKKINSLLIDADGLNCLSEINDWWNNNFPKNFVITPHLGEFSRLTKLSKKEIENNPLEIVCNYAKKWNATIMLKGPLSYISDGIETYVLDQPNPALSKGGSGDVLSGITSSFLAQGLNSIEASILGVSLLSKLGDFTEKNHGILSSSATKLIKAINKVKNYE
tara:strand:+ start:4020 stop:5552 length:1533 start_codon:yes stop_codon:yes gene_type:complete